MKKIALYLTISLPGLLLLAPASAYFMLAGYNRKADIVFAIATLCLSFALPGALVARTKERLAIFMGVIVAGIVILGLDIALLIRLETQDVDYGHTIPIFELFLAWLLVLLVVAMIIRSRRYIFLLTATAIGLVALCIGLYLKLMMDYHERAAIAFGAGCLCLLAGAVGFLISRKQPHHIKS